jgi:hypothetical protein
MLEAAHPVRRIVTLSWRGLELELVIWPCAALLCKMIHGGLWAGNCSNNKAADFTQR